MTNEEQNPDLIFENQIKALLEGKSEHQLKLVLQIVKSTLGTKHIIESVSIGFKEYQNGGGLIAVMQKRMNELNNTTGPNPSNN